MDSGLYGPLETVYPPSTAPGWSAFATGKNAGKSNQLYWGKSLDPGTYRVNQKGESHLVSPELWGYASDEGLTCVVHNLPTTFPPRRIDGCMVSGFDLPGHDTDWTHPAELKHELEERFDYSPVEPGKIRDLGPVNYLARYAQHSEKMLMGAEHLMDRYPDWDLFVTCFTLIDRVIHHFMECRHELEANMSFGDPIRRAYTMADQYLAKLLNKVEDQEGEEVAVLVLSDHGSRPVDKGYNLNTALIKSGLANLSEVGKSVMRCGGSSDVAQMHHFFDWPNTKAWVCPDMLGGGSIYINDDRFPQPAVKDKEEVLEQVEETVLNLPVPPKETPPIERVARKEEIYSGPFVNDFPDLICFSGDRWKWDPHVLRPHMFIKGALRGEHYMEGFYCVTAHGGEPGEEKHHILDIFPTVMHLLGLDVPGDVDGESILGETGKRNPLPSEPRGESVYSDQLRAKLEDLGYV